MSVDTGKESERKAPRALGGDDIRRLPAAGKLALHVCAGDGILLAKGDVTIGADAFTDQVNWLGLHVYFDFHGCADVAGGASMFNGKGGG